MLKVRKNSDDTIRELCESLNNTFKPFNYQSNIIQTTFHNYGKINASWSEDDWLDGKIGYGNLKQSSSINR